MENHASENKALKDDDILALDVATHCGYFSKHEAGTWNLTENRRRNDNKMHGSFRTLLIDFIRKYDIKQIVAEDVSINRHFYDLRRLSELRGVLLEVCDELNLPEPEFVNPAALKKWATGDGHATKSKMVETCKKYGYVPTDDNAADACHLFFYYIRKHRL